MHDMKTTKAPKGERRAHRTARERRRRDERLVLHAIGGVMDAELQADILAAFERLDVTAPWSDIAGTILPVIQRVRQPYPIGLAPFTLTVPPGIPTGFGIDLGPAFGHVTAEMLDSWAVDVATVLATALDNLRRLVVREPPQVDPFAVEGHAFLAVQGQGWGSALVLVPDVLAPILGPEPRLLMTPIRNTLVAMPESVDADLAVDLWLAFADGRHDELAVEPMRWTGHDVVALADRSLGLPN